MEYRKLGNSGLKVSEMGLGGNNFGSRANKEISINIINSALEKGVNFIDTAASYSDGLSEEIIGEAVKGKRSGIIIATKFGHPRNIKPDQQGGSRSYIIQSLESSLSRLNTDYIDLYYIHVYDPKTPIEETLRTLDDLVRSGKVRYIGCSNFAAWQLCGSLWTSKYDKLEPFIALQPKYNLLDRGIEQELVPCCQSYGVGIVPWAPLAGGFLTGKYRKGQPIPTNSRTTGGGFRDVLTDANYDKLAKLEVFAKEHGYAVGELAVAWLLAHTWISSVIAGAMNLEQLSTNLAAGGWKLTAEELSAVDKIA